MNVLILILASFGNGLKKVKLSIIIQTILKDKRGSHRNRLSVYSKSTLERFLKRYEIKSKQIKNIDPQQIAQITEDNRDALFFA